MAGSEAVLGSRQIYILPTRHGLMFALVLAALLLGAVNYSNALAYLLAFLLASMAVVSILHTQRNLLGLRITVIAGEPVFAGDSAGFRVCLHNDRATRYALRVETRELALPALDVPARDQRCITLALPAVRRGWLECPPLLLATVFPLGLARAWSRRIRLPARCLVYPRPATDAAIRLATGSEGESAAGSLEDGEDFTGLRGFQPGDPLARISWKTLARGQGLYTKEFRAPLAETRWIDWDDFSPLATEDRLSLMTRALLDADAAGMVYGLRLPGGVVLPDSGTSHRQRCLEALALHEDRH